MPAYISDNFLFRHLSSDEVEQFIKSANENYVKGSEISEDIWHPVYVAECKRINATQTMGELMDEEDAKRIAYLNSPEGKAEDSRLDALRLRRIEESDEYEDEESDEDEDE
jgi:hypothetical protein